MIGLASDELLKKKVLKELIAPGTERAMELAYFCNSLLPGLPGRVIVNTQPVPTTTGDGNTGAVSRVSAPLTDSATLTVEIPLIADPAGPAGSDPDLQVIVVSAETLGGATFCNDLR